MSLDGTAYCSCRTTLRNQAADEGSRGEGWVTVYETKPAERDPWSWDGAEDWDQYKSRFRRMQAECAVLMRDYVPPGLPLTEPTD